jgi:hypothetical protein
LGNGESPFTSEELRDTTTPPEYGSEFCSRHPVLLEEEFDHSLWRDSLIEWIVLVIIGAYKHSK